MQASKLAFFAGAALILATAFCYFPKWKQPTWESTLTYDVSGYYFYLPAIFIYGDVKKLSFRDGILQKYRCSPGPDQAFLHAPSGNFVMKYSCGQAIQFLPWFAAGHAAAKMSGLPTDGFSQPYQSAISWGSLFVALLGLWFLRRILLECFSEAATAIALLLISFATNYLNYAAVDHAMTHNWLFTLYTLLIFNTMRFYRQPTRARAAAIGLLVGWAALTRPTEIVSVLLPLLWGIGSLADLRGRFVFFKAHAPKLALAALVCAAVGSLQMIYWKYASGEWFVYSYQEQGFSWLRPHLHGALLSGRAGWFLYCPVFVLALFGFVRLFRTQRQVFPAVAAFCLIFTYIVCSWDIWWYGGSLGQRAMVQSYPVWAFPLAAFAEWVAEGKIWRRLAFSALAGLLVFYNLWLTHQAHKGGYWAVEEMNTTFLRRTVGRFDNDPGLKKLLDHRESFRGEPQAMTEVLACDFESDSLKICRENAISGSKSACVGKGAEFSAEFQVPLSARKPGHRWLRASATFRLEQKEWDVWRMPQFCVKFLQGERTVKQAFFRPSRLMTDGETRADFLDVKIPGENFDRATVFFWSGGSEKRVLMDDLKVVFF